MLTVVTHRESLPSVEDVWTLPATSLFGPRVELAPGLVAREVAEAHRPWEGYELTLTVRAVPGTEGRAGRFVCSRFSLAQVDDGPPVTSEAVRQVPVAALVRELAGALWRRTGGLHPDDTDPPEGAWRVWLDDDEIRRLRDQGPTRETLGWVAHTYRLAVVLGDPPTQAVEQSLGLPRSTAGRWVTLARREGLLGAAEGPGKAGG